MFQYPLADRVGFWGCLVTVGCAGAMEFQYPLADRVGFWGGYQFLRLQRSDHVSVSSCGSSWFLGGIAPAVRWKCATVSVSSCGSSWFLGSRIAPAVADNEQFQYPLADRVGFWGPPSPPSSPPVKRFSILLRIELVFGGAFKLHGHKRRRVFQYPLADRVGFWGTARP